MSSHITTHDCVILLWHAGLCVGQWWCVGGGGGGGSWCLNMLYHNMVHMYLVFFADIGQYTIPVPHSSGEDMCCTYITCTWHTTLGNAVLLIERQFIFTTCMYSLEHRQLYSN